MKRRQFMRTLAAPAVFGFPMIVPRRVLGAGLTAPSDRITFASIGVGSQGTGNLRGWLNKDDVRVVAVCDVRQEYRQRVESVKPNSQRQWGTMEVDQMLHHLNLACGGSQGFYDLPDESYLISRTLFKWILVDWYPEQPVGLRLPTGFKIPHSKRFEFAYEKSQLLKILAVDWNARTEDAWKPHPMFGKMTPKEWGKLLQIHVDYHLRQFAA